MDRISRLPPGVIESILCLLPIEEAARTSILSRGWRYHWTTIPRLAFSEFKFKVSTGGAELSVLEQTFDKPSERKEMTKRCKLFYAIYQILLLHQGPIYQFNLLMVVDDSCVEIDHIILHLSRKNTVKTLVLDFVGWYTLPLSFFSLHQLTELYLAYCVLELPPSFNGFGSLTRLRLQVLRTSEKSLLRLLSSCPLLKDLSLGIYSGYTIDRRTIFISDSGDATIVDFFKCLPCVEHLSIWFYIVLSFHPERLPEKLPTALVHLKCLCLNRLCFSHKYGLPFMVLLIRSSPNLEELEIELDWSDEIATSTCTLEDYSDIMLEHLKVFKILCFTNKKYELDFVKLILAKSPVLKKATIIVEDLCEYEEPQDEESHSEESDYESQSEESEDESQASQVSEILLSCQCASPVVKISVVINY